MSAVACQRETEDDPRDSWDAWAACREGQEDLVAGLEVGRVEDRGGQDYSG